MDGDPSNWNVVKDNRNIVSKDKTNPTIVENKFQAIEYEEYNDVAGEIEQNAELNRPNMKHKIKGRQRRESRQKSG